MKRIICVILSVLMLSATFFTVAYAEEYVNAALNCVSTASSAVDSSHSSYYANDGINDNADYTYWQSAAEDKNAWWQVDLGLSYQISRIEYEPRINSPKEEKINFEVRASNDKDFASYEVLAVCESEFSDGKLTIEINPTERFRYIRLAKTDGMVFSIGEIGFYVNMASLIYGNDTGNFVTEHHFDTDEASRYVTPFDVVGTQYEKDVALLCQLNIMRGYEDGTFMPGKKITRAEFAAVVARIIDIDYTPSEPTFYDVPKSHWAYNEIEAASEFGLVKGVAEGKFAPSEYITSTQALTVFVRMLGYGFRAEEQGGYPGGYRAVAGTLGLLGLSGNGEDITRGEIAKMLLKALETDIMQQTSFGDETVIKVIPGETILTNYLGLDKKSGIITATEKTALTSADGVVNGNYVMIDGVQFVCKNPYMNNYLGYSVEYYYDKKSDTPKEIIAVVPREINEVITILSENYPYFSGDNLYYYTDEEKEHKKSVRVLSTVDVIYNGGAYIKDYTKNELIPSDGTITLIDNGGDRTYDVMRIVSEDTYTVKWASQKDGAIYVKQTNQPVKFEAESDDITVYNYKTGAILTLSDLKEWDVISVAKSYNPLGKEIFTITVSTEYAAGEVTEKDNRYVTLDGENKYKVAPCLQLDDIALMDTGIFHLDYKGRIADFDGTSSDSGEYGFLCGILETSGLDSDFKFKIYTAEGTFITPSASKKLKVDGASLESNSEVISHIKLQTSDGSGEQVIKYVLNSKGELIGIDTVYQNTIYETDKNLSHDYTASNSYYMNSNIVGMVFGRDKDTVMMKIPEDINDEKEFEILPSSYLENSTQYSFEAFDGGESRIAKLFLFRDSSASSGISEGARMFVVDRVTRIADENGDAKNCLYGLYKGEEVSYTEGEEGIIAAADLKRGDIIALKINSSNQIKEIEKKFYPVTRPSTASDYSISPEAPQVGSPYSRRYYGYGTVGYREGVMARIDIDVTDKINTGLTNTLYTEMLANLTSEILDLYVYDSVEDRVYLGSADDVIDAATVGASDASKVFIYAKEGNIYDMVVFK